MEKRTLLALSALLEAISLDPRMKALEEEEARLSKAEDFLVLTKEKDAKAERFEETRRYFGEESDAAKQALHELYLAKKAMDEHPLALAYETHYKEVRLLFDEMDRILFGPFKGKARCGGCHDSN